MSLVVDAALLIETTVEVVSSPATFTVVASRAIDATWTLHPSVDHQDTWPRVATHFEVDAVYRDGTTRSTTGQMTGSPQTGPIVITFNADADNRLPAGGEVKFVAKFYSDSGWLAGIATTDFMAADIAGNLLIVPEMNITEQTVPLTSSTTYQHRNTLTWDDGANGRTWGSTPSTATLHDLSGPNVGSTLAAVAAITLSEEASALGYVWETSGQDRPPDGSSAEQSYTFQTLDDRTTPDAGLSFSAQSFTSKPLLAFERLGAPATGRNVWIDPRDDAHHVRPVALHAGSPFDSVARTELGPLQSAD